MTRRAISVYMAATCAMVIVAPGRFVCGIVFAVEICLLMLLGILFKALIKKISLRHLSQVLMLCFVVYFTLLYRQLLALFMPEVALQLEFLLFLPAISTFTTVFLLDRTEHTLKVALLNDAPSTLLFAGYILAFSLIRDVFGYGTLSLPYYGDHLEIVLFNPEGVSVLSFLATIPGAMILTSLLLSLYLYFEKKYHILIKAGA